MIPRAISVRAIFADTLDDIPRDFDLACRRFIMFIAVDSRGLSDDHIRSVAARLFRQGCVHACVWGPESERVRDLFIEACADYPDCDDDFIMVSGREQRFEQMLWFFLYATGVATRFADTCKARVAVTVGSRQLARAVHGYLSEPHTESLDNIAYQDMSNEAETLGPIDRWFNDLLDESDV